MEGDCPLLVTGAVALDLNGCTLAFNGRGSVFEIASGGHLVLTNGVPGTGAVTGGDADWGGGVHVLDGGAFTMDGGAITGCVAWVGAGVCVDDGGAFAMNGGRIAGNATYWYGGGVHVGEGGALSVSGSPVVSGNVDFDGKANNVTLGWETAIAVNGLAEGASIGVAPIEWLTPLEPIAVATNAAAGDRRFFFCDDPVFGLEEANGEILLTAPITPWWELQLRLFEGGVFALEDGCAAMPYDYPLTITNDVVLDLAGRTLAGNGQFPVFLVSPGGHLTLTNSVEGSGSVTGGGGGVTVSEGGVFTMDGGLIAGNAGDSGGGVFVWGGGVFEMNGGAISGNECGSETAASGFGITSGGSWYGNCGGGVYVGEGAAFRVSGAAVVAGNTNAFGEASNVFLDEGATIAVAGLAPGASFGVEIETEASYIDPFTVTDGAAPGDLARFSSDDPDLKPVLLASGEIGLRPPLTWEALQDLLDEGGTITLTEDCTAAPDDSYLYVTETVVLDLAGHTIKGSGRQGYSVLRVEDGGRLTLTNSVESSGAIMGGGYAGVYVGWGGAFTMDGGTICSNSCSYGCGGVYVSYGTFTMNGGEIRDNSMRGSGGGVLISSDGTFTMNGGTIAGNTAEGNGGGVCGAFTMNGGEIRGNSAGEAGGGVSVGMAVTMNGGAIVGNTARYGGGVVVGTSGGTFTMNGGTIAGNGTASDGGGVFLLFGTMTISGSAVISGNTNGHGEADNLFLYQSSPIAVGELAAGASIGVKNWRPPAADSPVAFATGASAGDAAYFLSDHPSSHVEFANDQLWLAQGVAYPAYLDGATDAVKANWVAWAKRYGAVMDEKYASHFLLDIDPRTEIPADAELLKVTAFRVSETGMYLEVASDVAEFSSTGTASLMVGNGYLGVILSPSLSPGAPCYTNAPLVVTFRNGRAVYDAHAAPSSSQMPPSFFIRPIITDR